jgi:hypothetical protein
MANCLAFFTQHKGSGLWKYSTNNDELVMLLLELRIGTEEGSSVQNVYK